MWTKLLFADADQAEQTQVDCEETQAVLVEDSDERAHGPSCVEYIAPFPMLRPPSSFCAAEMGGGQEVVSLPEPAPSSGSAATKTYGWCPIVVQPWRK